MPVGSLRKALTSSLETATTKTHASDAAVRPARRRLRPNGKWLADADITCLDRRGWLHVAAVIDLFSPRGVGWSMSAGA